LCMQKKKQTAKKKAGHLEGNCVTEDDFFFCGGLGYVYVDSCRSVTLQSFGPLCACQTLSPPYILITVVLAVCCSADGGEES
jgi:hypothetical protein